jgi:putative transposase
MKDKFRNKFLSDSARMQSWDYGSDGANFVTICAKNRV